MDLDDLARRVSALSDHALLRLCVDWARENGTFLFVVLALIVGFAIGRYHAYRAATFQTHGEALVSRVLKRNFGPPDYHLMNHVTLRLKDGTTEVDHVLVSRFGVFVIESKHYKGRIFANANHATWTQVLFRHRFRFQNPILQNLRHVRAVQELLDFLPAGAVESAVVFTGAAEFRTEIPRGVFSLSGLIEYLREQTIEVMSRNRMHFCVGRLEAARLAISGETDVEHVQSLERRHRSLV